MEIRQLRYFEAVARHRHFTRAAQELHVAQSALSHQVRQLERELGVELLRRTTRSVEPTESGSLVAARARAVLAQTDALQSEIDELQGLVRGRLGIGAMLFGGGLDIPALLASFTATYPHVEVGVREGTASRMLELLAAGSLDISFALELEPPAGVERLELSREELAVVTSPTHPLAGRTPLPVTELAAHPLIAFGPGSSSRRLTDLALADAGVEPQIAVESNDLALTRSLAARGLGVAILPRSFVELPGPRVSFRPLSPALELRVVLWWQRGRRLGPAARAFVEFARAAGAGAATPPAPRARRAPGAAR
ncbi:MAG TPA: LysR substrate-binding domain-containing protein [Solirubrobacteraceae bacterium]|jgi:DNA-binding transcriptional LysR family regulator